MIVFVSITAKTSQAILFRNQTKAGKVFGLGIYLKNISDKFNVWISDPSSMIVINRNILANDSLLS